LYWTKVQYAGFKLFAKKAAKSQGGMNVEKGCHEYGKLKLITLKNFASYFFIYENRLLG